jgi:hypothetical protein
MQATGNRRPPATGKALKKMKLVALLGLCLAAGAAAARCPDHAFTEPPQIKLDQRPVLIATHASSSFDAEFAAKRGVDEAVRFARDQNFQIVYLQDDREDPNFYAEDCKPDHWVYSEGGELSFNVPSSHVYLVGGHLELCLANTLNQLLDRWSAEPLRDRTVEVLMDGVYSNGKSVDETTPYFKDMERYRHIRSYGRPAGEHWGKITMLETMGVIIREAQQYQYLEGILPQWRRSVPAGYRVELRLNDGVPLVLQQGNGLRAPVLKFQFVDSAITLMAKSLFSNKL